RNGRALTPVPDSRQRTEINAAGGNSEPPGNDFTISDGSFRGNECRFLPVHTFAAGVAQESCWRRLPSPLARGPISQLLCYPPRRVCFLAGRSGLCRLGRETSADGSRMGVCRARRTGRSQIPMG